MLRHRTAPIAKKLLGPKPGYSMRYSIGRLKDVMKHEKGKIKNAKDMLYQEQPEGREQSPGNSLEAGSIARSRYATEEEKIKGRKQH